jgi:hypothetical protein
LCRRYEHHESTPNAGKKGVKGIVSPCRGRGGQRPPQKAQDAVLHLQRGEAPLNLFGGGLCRRYEHRESTPNAGKKGVKGIVSPCGLLGARGHRTTATPLQEARKAQDAVLHLQRGEAPLNPFGEGLCRRYEHHESTPNAGKKGVKGIVSPCRGCGGQRPPQKAQDAVLHLQRGEAPLNPFGR